MVKIQYGRAKSAISETGDGLGKDFVKRIMPEGTWPNDETLQNTIDSFYSERRRLAAERRARAAEEARRAALAEEEALKEQAKLKSEQEEAAKRAVEEAERREKEAADLAKKAEDEKTKKAALQEIDKQRDIKKKAVKRAGKAMDERQKIKKGIGQKQQKIAEETKREASEKARAEKFAESVINQDLLERLDSTSKMNDVIRLVKKNKIPKQFHAELIEQAAGWAADSTSTQLAGTSISAKGAIWWHYASGRAAQMSREAKIDAFRRRTRGRNLDDFAAELRVKLMNVKKEVSAVAPFADQISIPTLTHSLRAVMKDLAGVLSAAIDRIDSKEAEEASIVLLDYPALEHLA